MLGRQKVFLGAVALAVGLTLLMILNSFGGKVSQKSEAPGIGGLAPQKAGQSGGDSPPFGNAFLPGVPYNNGPDRLNPPPPTAVENLIGPISDPFAGLGESIKELNTSPLSISQEPRGKELDLPVVLDAELNIDNIHGISGELDYLTYFSTNGGKIDFDWSKLNMIAKNEYGVFLTPHDLVNKILGGDLSEQIRQSLLVMRDFTDSKVNFVKSIGVRGEAAGLVKRQIAISKLTVNLINKALGFSMGEVNRQELESDFNKYKNTTMFYHDELLKSAGIASLNFGRTRSVLKSLFEILGIKSAVAVAPPFGGPIASPIPCTCPALVGSFQIPIGPPVPPIPTGSLFYPSWFLAEPVFFPYKSLRPGAFHLGLYEPALVPCHLVVLACPPMFPAVVMAGTSL